MEAVLAAGGRNVSVLQQANRTIPVVFVTVSDPVSGGFVESMSHPGGNTTGFSILEWSMSGKWLELLKQLVPPNEEFANDDILTTNTASITI